MSETECREWQSTVYVAAFDVEKAAVLLRKNSHDSYTLPHFAAEGGVWEASPASLQKQIEPALAIEGQVLYRADYREDRAACRAESVLILECRAAQAAAGEWFTRPRLAGTTLANPGHCSILEQVLGELESGRVPPQKPPWVQPGWLNEAAAWMTAELNKKGWTPVGAVEMVRSWSLSYVMRVQASRSPAAEPQWFYFKTSIDLPLFVNEAVVTKELAALYPDHIPEPLALEAQKNWMLLPAFGALLGHDAPLENRLEILRQFAALQKRSTTQIDQLLAMGCCDRRLDWMMAEIEHLLAHPEVDKVLTAEKTAQLRALAAPLKRLCRKLFDYAVPNALIHGDLHGNNVAAATGLERPDDSPAPLLFFDWTDCAVSHPFFDMLLIYTVKETAERQTMRDLYLAYWLDYEPWERLLEIWQLAEALSAVYHAVSYLYILDGLEEWGKFELNWAMPYWLGKILDYGDFIHEN